MAVRRGVGGFAIPPVCKTNDLHNPLLLLISINYYHNYYSYFRKVRKR